MAAQQARRRLPALPARDFELRCGERSTIICTQYRQKDWHARLGADVTAEAIMDRIVHKTAWVDMGEMNMRAAIGTAASSSPRS